MQPSPADDGTLVRDLNIRKPYLDQIARGAKTVEVRVAYPKLRTLQPGDRIRFVSGDHHCLTVVRRVATYDNFEAMLRTEDPASIAPDIPAPDELLSLIRTIYPPEKEALGVLAIQIERLGSA
jgi:ASC-1-like (ASCH) protein